MDIRTPLHLGTKSDDGYVLQEQRRNWFLKGALKFGKKKSSNQTEDKEDLIRSNSNIDEFDDGNGMSRCGSFSCSNTDIGDWTMHSGTSSCEISECDDTSSSAFFIEGSEKDVSIFSDDDDWATPAVSSSQHALDDDWNQNPQISNPKSSSLFIEESSCSSSFKDDDPVSQFDDPFNIKDTSEIVDDFTSSEFAGDWVTPEPTTVKEQQTDKERSTNNTNSPRSKNREFKKAKESIEARIAQHRVRNNRRQSLGSKLSTDTDTQRLRQRNRRGSTQSLVLPSHDDSDVVDEFERDRKKLLAHSWWKRLGSPNKKKMVKACLQKDMAVYNITPADIDLLPWMPGGFSIDVMKMMEWLDSVDTKELEKRTDALMDRATKAKKKTSSSSSSDRKEKESAETHKIRSEEKESAEKHKTRSEKKHSKDKKKSVSSKKNEDSAADSKTLESGSRHCSRSHRSSVESESRSNKGKKSHISTTNDEDSKKHGLEESRSRRHRDSTDHKKRESDTTSGSRHSHSKDKKKSVSSKKNEDSSADSSKTMESGSRHSGRSRRSSVNSESSRSSEKKSDSHPTDDDPQKQHGLDASRHRRHNHSSHHRSSVKKSNNSLLDSLSESHNHSSHHHSAMKKSNTSLLDSLSESQHRRKRLSLAKVLEHPAGAGIMNTDCDRSVYSSRSMNDASPHRNRRISKLLLQRDLSSKTLTSALNRKEFLDEIREEGKEEAWVRRRRCNLAGAGEVNVRT